MTTGEDRPPPDASSAGRDPPKAGPAIRDFPGIDPSGTDGPIRWKSFATVIICLMVFDVTMGLSYPLISLLLESRGFSPVIVGLNASMMPLGLVLCAPFFPRLAERFGPWRFAVGCIAATAILLTLIKVSDTLAAWFVLRFLLGVVQGGLFAISEVWINQLASGRNRGRMIAIYAALLSLGFGSGPFLLPTTGIEGWPPFLLGITFTTSCLVFMIFARRSLPPFQAERRASFLAFLPLAPTLLLAAFLLGVFDTSTLSLFPLYGLGRGLDEGTASYLLGVLIVGNVVLQFPLGWLADIFGRRRALNACALLTALGALTLPAARGTFWQWPLVLVWGTTGFGIYTLALADLGDRFTGSELLAGTAALTAMFGLGGIAGPTLGGAAMDQFGPEGLPALVGIAYALLLVVSLIRGRR